MVLGIGTKAVVATTFEDTRLQLCASSVTSHVVRQAGGLFDHIGNRGFVSKPLGPFLEVRLHLLEKFRIREKIDAG